MIRPKKLTSVGEDSVPSRNCYLTCTVLTVVPQLRPTGLHPYCELVQLASGDGTRGENPIGVRQQHLLSLGP